MVKKSKFVIVLFLVVCCTTLTAQENIRLKVLTYNLRFGELASLEELAEFIKSQDPDVVAPYRKSM
jgi:endonuclease/exonuclease/phosphatase (EEP) superfamily protein YafD